MRLRRSVVGLGLSFPIAIFLVACGESPAALTGPAVSSIPTHRPLVRVVEATLKGTSKMLLTNAQGMTLYYFTLDTPTKIACTGQCAVTWPPLRADSEALASSSGLPGKLSVLNGPHGRQVLYNGHPLYTYSRDVLPGDAAGEGIGGRWFVAIPDLPPPG